MPLLRSAALPLFAVALLSGCIKPADQKAPENTPAPKAAEPFATAPAAPTQPPSVAGIPAAAIGAAERVKMKVEVASTATKDNGAVYREAKAFYDQKQYPQALGALNGIQQELLTPEQEKAVAELRSKISAAMSGK